MDANTSVRVGIVGLGNIGRYHADRLIDLGADLAGGMDIMPEARAQFAERYATNVYDDPQELYEAVDAVVITTPNKYHEEYAISALEAGLDVLLEKPLAHNLESAERIVEAAHQAEGFCMVGFNNRFANSVEVLKGYQREGRFGTVHHVEANYMRRRGIPGRGSWFTSKEVSGGGALIDIGVHAIDLALYFLDFPEVIEVAGTVRSKFGSDDNYAFLKMWGDDVGPEGFDVDDSATAFIRCADGRTVNLEVAWAANRPTDDEFIVRGTKAGATLDRDDGSLTVYETGKEGTDHFADSVIRTRQRDTHRAEQEIFLSAVASGTHPGRNTVEQALTVQRVIDAIYRSSEEGRAIQFESAVENRPVQLD